jgi:hypothetical protein
MGSFNTAAKRPEIVISGTKNRRIEMPKKKTVKRGSVRRGPKGACKPALKLKGSTKAQYGELCKIYSGLRDEYHGLGRQAMGSPKNSKVRRLYEQAKRDYKKVGKALFKMGHPKSEWGPQHRR